MILNRKNEAIVVVHNTSGMQKQIEECSKNHLKQYDSIVGTTDIREVVAV